MGGNTKGDKSGRYTPTEKENEKKYGGLISFVWYNIAIISSYSLVNGPEVLLIFINSP